MHVSSDSHLHARHGCFAVKVRTRAENSVSAALREKGFEVVLPTYTDCRHYSDRIRKVDCAVFPGYVFVFMGASETHRVSVTTGVSYVVKVCNSLQPLPPQEVAILRALSGIPSGYEPCETIAIGERVSIESGPFRGQQGILTRKAGNDRVVLSLNSIFSSVSIDLRDTVIRILPHTDSSTAAASRMPRHIPLTPQHASLSA